MTRPSVHALMITGGGAAARIRHAWTTAAACLCSSACGTCPACRKVARHIHPDVLCVEPEGRELTVEEIRKLRGETRLVPNEGVCRVVIIPRAELLNEHAQNALLAVLEEPPGPNVFLLCLPSAEQLLPTVRSRCSTVVLPDQAEEYENPEAIQLWEISIKTLMDAWLAGDEWTVVKTFLSMEKLPRDDMRVFLSLFIKESVCRVALLLPLTARRLCRIIDIAVSCQNALEVNAGVGHICGALASSFSFTEKRKKQRENDICADIG